jgi:hypothetical protein
LNVQECDATGDEKRYYSRLTQKNPQLTKSFLK